MRFSLAGGGTGRAGSRRMTGTAAGADSIPAHWLTWPLLPTPTDKWSRDPTPAGSVLLLSAGGDPCPCPKMG